jgi:hypothetical protein
MADDIDSRDIEVALARAFAFELPGGTRAQITGRVARAISGDLPERPATTRSRRILKGRSGIVVGIAAALLIAGSAAAGSVIVRSWGPVDHPATVADIEAEIAATIATTPLPPGYVYPINQIREATEGDGMRAQKVGVLSVQEHAMCAWTDAWLIAWRAQNDIAMAAALPTIESFPRWTLFADPRFADDGMRQEATAVAAAVRVKDAAPLNELFQAAGCQGQVSRP